MPTQESVVYFNNYQTRTQALGLAKSSDKQVYYLSTAGPGVACKAIWATLVSGKSRLTCSPWSHHDLRGAAPLKALYQALPDSNFLHMVSLHTGSNLLIATDPLGARYSTDRSMRQSLLSPLLPGVVERFVSWLNAETDVPIWAGWGEGLWQAALTTRLDNKLGITLLHCYGDCLGAWLIESEYPWLTLVQSLLHTGKLLFPADGKGAAA